MSSSAAFATPPAPRGDHSDLRPLDAIAATSAGGVPQSRIHRILTDLEAPLAVLHEQGRVHGALSPATIGLDTKGKAHLMPWSAAGMDGLAEQGGEPEEPQAGYAAFEQYADDALLPRGPWTDIYALSAVACQLITGAPPPDAESRRDRDVYVPLAQRMPEGYDAAFLAAVDAGLAMAAARRPNSMSAYLALFGGMEPAPAMPALPEPEVVMVQEDYGDDDDMPAAAPRRRRRLPFRGLFLALLVAVLALPVWMWTESGKGLTGERAGGRAGSASFVPLSQRDARQDDASRPATDGGAVAAQETRGVSADADTAGGGGAPGQENGAAAGRPMPAAGGPGPEAGAGAASGALAQSGAPNPAGGPAALGAGMAPSAGGRPGEEGGGAGAEGDSGSRAAGAPQPYQSTVTLGGASVSTGTETTAPARPGQAGAVSAKQAGSAESTEPAGSAGSAKATRPAAGAPVPVRIDVRPWGQIVIDGVVRGVSPPLKELRLPPGTYAVTIRNTGLPSHRMTLEVKAGSPAVISHVFN